MSPWIIYFITRLDTICTISYTGLILLLIALIINIGFYCTGTYDEEENFVRITKSWFKRIIPLFIIFLTTSLITPSTQQAAAIYIIPAVVNNKSVQQESKEFYNLAKEYLKKQVGEDGNSNKK